MRSRAPLALMEQMVMILVFALAAALCLQAFVKSDEMSRRGEARDQAALKCQSAAETIRACGGTPEEALTAAAQALGTGVYDGAALELHYSEDWSGCDSQDYAYCLRAEGVDTGLPGLAKAAVQVAENGEGGEVLFQIEVAWQVEMP